MKIIKTIFYRIYHGIMWCALWFLPWKQNKGILSGEGTIKELPKWLIEQGKINHHTCNSVLIVSDQGLKSLGIVDKIAKEFNNVNIKTTIFTDVVPNPTITNIEEGVTLYLSNDCDVIVAIGGGSPMDCAKGICAIIGRPRKSIPELKGVLKISLSKGNKLPPLVAIPTTSGTGSEATLAAVVSNPDTHEKYAINDPLLIPKYVVMDPLLTITLPPHITSTTGMDALTHAVEAYIGHENNAQTKKDAIEAVKLINQYLLKAYQEKDNVLARNKMQQAAYLAGKAFTRAYIGYVHAIAHTLGGHYAVPHGLANAVILPYVLEAYGKNVYTKLAKLADAIGITGDSKKEKALAFIKWIKDLNKEMNIPNKIKDKEGNQLIKEDDLDDCIKKAMAEANPLYPCPVVWNYQDFQKLYYKIM